ncbi:RES family NAD+ phosphorylase [Streptomyces sp. AV19]|uniref:RES family NAD+ phosphorylase n=1 Tax=Streptomyces sp. AV19 TaxID=2793068 RepID=UPI001F402F4E|nr:RES family NAD+ phosphorylase [Streptomyces sp. AV19]MDG4534005.1 RES family NAD+ phosphorylase [Streptomyces sp. AV19]
MTGDVSPATYTMRPHTYVVPAGRRWWRVHTARRPAGQFKPAAPGARFCGNRFDGTPRDPYGSLYMASDPATALAETLLRSVDFDAGSGMRLVPYAAVAGRALSMLVTEAELRLISLITEEDLAAVCQDSWLLEAEGEHYATTRRWASAMRARSPDAMGLVWQSRRHRPRLSSVLFRDRCPDAVVSPVRVRAYRDLGSPRGIAEANLLLAPLRAAIVPPWPQ